MFSFCHSFCTSYSGWRMGGPLRACIRAVIRRSQPDNRQPTTGAATRYTNTLNPGLIHKKATPNMIARNTVPPITPQRASHVSLIKSRK